MAHTPPSETMPPKPDHDHEDNAALAPPARRSGRWRALRRVVVASAIIGALSLLAHETAPPRFASRASTPFGAAFTPSAPEPARLAAADVPRYRLDDPDGIDPWRVEPVRLSPAAGAGQRPLIEDALAQGAFDVFEAPFLRVTVTEGGAPEGGARLFVTLARRAAEGQGLSIARTGERGRIDTKFGPVETLEATLTGAGSRVCAGFATLTPGAIRIDGWLCAPLGQAPEPRAIVCALDKLALNGQASPAADAAFRVAESRRDPACHPRPSLRDAAQTGSITRRPARRNEVKVRQDTQARP